MARRAPVCLRALEARQDSAELCHKAGHNVEILTGGGSGSVAIDLDLGGLNELQPGSYVFRDSSYRNIVWTRPASRRRSSPHSASLAASSAALPRIGR